MPNNFIEHKDRWLQIANGEFEYSILFIKCWLPFNAWYCNNYPDFNNNDRKILTKVKTDNNLFKTRLISLLEGTDEESYFFRNKLVKLHKQLEKCKVPKATECISLKNLNFRVNPITMFKKKYRNFTFKIELINPIPPQTNRIRIDIINQNNINILAYNHTKYSLEHFKNISSFSTLSETKRNILMDGFESINPNQKENLIVSTKKSSLRIIKDVLFIDNTDLLAQGIIEILYRLRCILFHGEIQPNKDNLKIYEPAFYMLRLLIKSLD